MVRRCLIWTLVLCAGYAAFPSPALAQADEIAPIGPVGQTDAQYSLSLAPPSDAVNRTYNLQASEVARLDVPQAAGVPFTMVVPIDGQSYTLDLEPFSVVDSSYQLLAQVEDGSLVSVPPGPVRTLRGFVQGMPGSVVAGSLFDSGLEAVIRLADDRKYWIEPLAKRFPDAPADQYVIYRQDDVLPNGGTCGVPTSTMPDEGAFGAGPRGAACNSTLCLVQLACDADVEYYNDYGSSIPNVEARIQSVINTVNVEYERDVQIRHVITTIIVRTAEPDPYGSSDAGTLLSQFRSQWNANHGSVVRDVAQLFTGRTISGSTIGIAWGIGLICSLTNAYCLVESDCCGSFACATDLSAHELGHLWGADHCSCSGYTMNPSITCANRFQPVDTIPEIIAHRDSRTCLDAFEAGSTTLPFSDTFPTTTLSASLWTGNDGATVETTGTNPPSAPNSLNLDGSASGGDQVRSAIIDMSGAGNIVLSYYYERAGGGNSPESGEDLIAEYLNSSAQWVEIDRQLGSGADMTNFAQRVINVPAAAQHATFRLRFRCISSNANSDDWFIDNVVITAEDFGAPNPDPMTFSSPPSAITATEVTMQATQASDSLTPPIEYFFTATSGPAGGTNSGWQSSRTYNDTGLTPNSIYSYVVRARDSAPAQNETADSTPASSVTTHVETPTGVTFGTVTDNSIEISAAGTFTNLGVGQTAFLFDAVEAAGDIGLRQWVTTNFDTSVFLSPDTVYTYQVMLRNRDGVQTPFGPAVPKATLSLTPAAPVLTNAGCNSMDIDVTANANPATTTYSIQCTATAPFDANWNGRFVSAAGAPAGAAVWRTDAQWGFTALSGMVSGTTYSFSVTARNQELIPTAAGPSASLATQTCAFGNGDMDDDGDVDLADGGVFMNCFDFVPVSGNCTRGDFNSDNVVDLSDFGDFFTAFTGP